MDIQLEILQGRLKQGNAAEGLNRFKISLRRFVIGSGAACHMVCKSRTISDRHCQIEVENDRVLVRDLQSAAGTFVNDVPVDGSQLLVHGDKLRIGRLEFRLLVADSRQPGAAARENPPVKPEEASIDTVVGPQAVDTLVTDLLQQEDEAAREARYADPAARYFHIDPAPPAAPEKHEPEVPPSARRPQKRGIGKLPPPPPLTADDSVSAAELALQEIFHPSKGIRKG